MGGWLVYVGRLFWVGEGINNTEAENKFPLLDTVDGIWYGAMLCQRKTTQRQNQIGVRRGWKEEGQSLDWEVRWPLTLWRVLKAAGREPRNCSRGSESE